MPVTVRLDGEDVVVQVERLPSVVAGPAPFSAADGGYLLPPGLTFEIHGSPDLDAYLKSLDRLVARPWPRV